MTDNDKMRKAIIQFGQDNPSLDLDFRLHTHGKYLTQEKAIVASRAFKAGAAWQAAQAEQSVPVVGEVVRRLKQTDIRLGNSSAGWIGCHTNDGKVLVDAAELERLRNIPDAEQEHLYDEAHRLYARGFNACRKLWMKAAIAAEGEKE